MVFDVASNTLGNGIGDVIISPEGCHTPFTARLCFDCTNNMAEYEAYIMGLRDAIDLRIKLLRVHGDSAMVINQVKVDWHVDPGKLSPGCVQPMLISLLMLLHWHMIRDYNGPHRLVAVTSGMTLLAIHNINFLFTAERLLQST